MRTSKKIVASALCLLVVLTGIYWPAGRAARAQTAAVGAASLSIEQLEQIVIGLQKQVAQAITVLKQKNGAVCGDGICQTGETTGGCPQDCATAATCAGTCRSKGYLSDYCNAWGAYPKFETGSCAAGDLDAGSTKDCIATDASGRGRACCCTNGGSVCGNGSCESEENSNNCPQDCQGNSNIAEISPYDADVVACVAASGQTYQTTKVKDYARWFLWNGCATQKSYNVTSGRPLIINVYGDDESCPYPKFTVYENRNNGWVATNQVDLSNSDADGSDGWIVNMHNYLYTPGSDKIKIVAQNCFYMKIFSGPAASSAVTVPLP